MPAPLIGLAVGAAARVAAKKVASNVAKKAATKKAAAANARGLKAAQKPTNKTGSKADRSDRRTLQGNSNIIKNADPARPNRIRGGSLYAIKTYGGFGVATAKRSPKNMEWQKEISKELNPVRKRGK
jgi:hypothetical protein